MTGPTCCTGGKNHLPRCPTHRTSANGKGVGKRTFFLVKRCESVSGCSFSRVIPATPPGAGDRSRLAEKYTVLPCCCILLLYKAG